MANRIKYTRLERTRKTPPDIILIITEGEVTEVQYFEAFRLHSIRLEVIGTGRSTLSLVREVIKIANKTKNEYARKNNIVMDDIEMQVWCVFDKDLFTPSDFNNAIRKAQSKGFSVAYSNEAFELWYLLHFDYITTPMSRDKLKKKLSVKLNRFYLSNDPDMYMMLYDKQSDAIRNAHKLMETYNTVNPARDNPSTTVHLLVEYLNEFRR